MAASEITYLRIVGEKQYEKEKNENSFDIQKKNVRIHSNH